VAEEKCAPFEQYKYPYSAPTIIHKAPEAATIASDYWLLRPQFVSRADSTNPYAVLVCFHHPSSCSILLHPLRAGRAQGFRGWASGQKVV
jgi:hypothetical protein